MNIRTQIESPQGVQDKTAVSVFRSIKSIVDLITGRAPGHQPIVGLGANATKDGLLDKINEVIAQLQSTPLTNRSASGVSSSGILSFLGIPDSDGIGQVLSSLAAGSYAWKAGLPDTIGVGQTLTVDANYNYVVAASFVNNGTVINNGRIAVV